MSVEVYFEKKRVRDPDSAGNIEEIDFRAAMSSTPQPGKLKCWGGPVAYIDQDFQYLVDNVDIDTIPDGLWTTSHDDATHYWHSHLLSGNKWAKGYDEGAAAISDAIFNVSDLADVPGSGTEYWVQAKVQVNDASNYGFIFYLQDNAGNHRVLIRFFHDGKIYSYDGVGWVDTGITWSTSTPYYLKIVLDDSDPDLHDVYLYDVDDVLLDSSTGMTNNDAWVAATIRLYLGVYANAAGGAEALVDDVQCSWTTLDFNDCLDQRVDIMVGGEWAWSGHVDTKEVLIDANAGDTYFLGLLDCSQRLVDEEGNYDMRIDSHNVAGDTEDRITTTNTPFHLYSGYAGILRTDPDDVLYVDDLAADSANEVSLATDAAPTLTGFDVDDNDHTATREKDDAPLNHILFRIAGTGNDAVYTLSRAVAAGDYKISKVSVSVKLKVTNFGGFNAVAGVRLSLYNYLTTDYDVFYHYVKPGQLVFNTYDFNDTHDAYGPNAYYPVPYIDVAGGNWNAKVKIEELCTSGHHTYVYIDYIRVRVTISKNPHAPIEGMIAKVDQGNKHVWLDTYPFLSSYVVVNDDLLVGYWIHNMIAGLTSGSFDEIYIDNLYKSIYQNFSSNNLSIIRTLVKIAGGYYWWTVDKDICNRIFYYRRYLYESHDFERFNGHVEGTDIDILPGWVDGAVGANEAKIRFDVFGALQGSWCLQLLAVFGVTNVYAMHEIPTFSSTIKEIEFALRVIVNDGDLKGGPLDATFDVMFRQDDDTYLGALRVAATTGDYALVAQGGGVTASGCTASINDYDVIKITFEAGPIMKLYVMQPGEDDFTYYCQSSIGDLDIAKVRYFLYVSIVGAVDNQVAMGYVKYIYEDDITALTDDLQPDPKERQRAVSIYSVTVMGKSDIFVIRDIDSNSPRKMLVTDDSLITHSECMNRAESIAEKYTTNPNSYTVVPVDGNQAFLVGTFMTSAALGFTNRIIRRVEFTFNSKDKIPHWKLDLDVGQPGGTERTRNIISQIQEDLNQTKVDRIS